MPAAGILKRLKKVGSQALDIAKSLNKTVYKPMAPLVSDALAALPGGAYIDKAVKFGSGALDKYGDSLSKYLENSDPKPKIKGGKAGRRKYKDSSDDDDLFSKYFA